MAGSGAYHLYLATYYSPLSSLQQVTELYIMASGRLGYKSWFSSHCASSPFIKITLGLDISVKRSTRAAKKASKWESYYCWQFLQPLDFVRVLPALHWQSPLKVFTKCFFNEDLFLIWSDTWDSERVSVIKLRSSVDKDNF